MISIGIVRKIDQLGRIVLPKEIRHSLDIEIGSPLEFLIDEDMIVLKKYTPGCIFCGEIGNLKIFNQKNICSNCINDIRKCD